MKFQVTFKDPDAFVDAIVDSVKSDLKDFKDEAIEYAGVKLSEEEEETIVDYRVALIEEKLSKFVRWGEYITIQFDTDKGTAVVLPVIKPDDDSN